MANLRSALDTVSGSPDFFVQHWWAILALIVVILVWRWRRAVVRDRRNVRGLEVTLMREGEQKGKLEAPGYIRYSEVFSFVIKDEWTPHPYLSHVVPETIGVYRLRRDKKPGFLRLVAPSALKPYEAELRGAPVVLDNGLQLSFSDTRHAHWGGTGFRPPPAPAGYRGPSSYPGAGGPGAPSGAGNGGGYGTPAGYGAPAGYGTYSPDDWLGSSGGPHGAMPVPPPSPPDSLGSSGGGTSQDDHANPRRRFLTGIAPERAPAGARISLIVQVTLAAARGPSAALKDFRVGPLGTVVTITVSAPGLVPLGDLEQDVTVPFAADSDPVRFGFLAGSVGLQSVQVRAFAGGTWLGDLTLEVSVETGASLEEGRPRKAPLPDLAAEPGEVTLEVSRTAGGGYSFRLLSGTLHKAVIIDRLARDPGEVVGQMIAELRAMSRSTAQYETPDLARRRLRSLGAQLWGDVVPTSIREQFWAQRDRIRLFTIASEMDTVPWELLYPVDLDKDAGFLVEQFPVVRRVYGQDRASVLRLNRGTAFVVPPKSPPSALEELDAVRAALPGSIDDKGTQSSLHDVLRLFDADTVPSVLHFAGHNTFTDETGSLISLDGGPLRPSDLSYARQRRTFKSASPLVFLNGCRTAGEVPGFTQTDGWASAFMDAGAGAFIGSLWAVRSASAQTFASEFYRALVGERATLGVASLRARQAIAADEGDPTWLAYTIYGNPSASIEVPQEPQAVDSRWL